MKERVVGMPSLWHGEVLLAATVPRNCSLLFPGCVEGRVLFSAGLTVLEDVGNGAILPS